MKPALSMDYRLVDSTYVIRVLIPESDVVDLGDISAVDGFGSDELSLSESLFQLAEVMAEIERQHEKGKDGDE